MILEASLALAKRGGVIVPASVLHHRWHIVVEHLVEDDCLHEELRNPRLIEHRVNANEALLGKVGAELERALQEILAERTRESTSIGS